MRPSRASVPCSSYPRSRNHRASASRPPNAWWTFSCAQAPFPGYSSIAGRAIGPPRDSRRLSRHVWTQVRDPCRPIVFFLTSIYQVHAQHELLPDQFEALGPNLRGSFLPGHDAVRLRPPPHDLIGLPAGIHHERAVAEEDAHDTRKACRVRSRNCGPSHELHLLPVAPSRLSLCTSELLLATFIHRLAREECIMTLRRMVPVL